MTTATLTDADTITLAFPLAAVEGLRHAITLAIHERPTSERDMLASIYGALVNPQPARAAPRTENEMRDGMRGLREVAGREGARPEPVDVLATLEGVGNFLIAEGATPADVVALHEARAAIAELIKAAKDVEWNARMTAPDDTYHEVGRKEMSRLTAALARVGGGK